MLVPQDARSYEMLMESHTAVIHDLRSRLAGDAAELVAAGIVATTDTREGSPAHEIVAAAEACQAGLIVIGTHGRRGVTRLAIGNVSRGVVHGAKCSILVVPTHALAATIQEGRPPDSEVARL